MARPVTSVDLNRLALPAAFTTATALDAGLTRSLIERLVRDGDLERLGRGDFVYTAEITPPLAGAPGPLLERAAPLKGMVDAVNVTDAPGARATMSSFAAAALLLQDGIEPVLQITCRDRNRIALAADLLGAAAHRVGAQDPRLEGADGAEGHAVQRGRQSSWPRGP